MSGQEPWEPWANDPESFERAVLAGLEERLNGAASATPTRDFGREFRDARLDGSYPDTKVVVSFHDLRTTGVTEERISVWEERNRQDPRKPWTVDPESLAEEIWVTYLVP